MKYGLAGAATGVDDGTVAAEILLARDFGGNRGDSAEHGFVFRLGIGQRCEMLSGADQDVRSGLRVDVLEGEDVGVVVNQFGGNLLCSDFAEQAVSAHWPSSAGASSRRMTRV